MTKTFCDKCKAEVLKDALLRVTLEAPASIVYVHGVPYRSSPSISYEVCRTCMTGIRRLFIVEAL